MSNSLRDRFLAEIAAAKAANDLKVGNIANLIANNSVQVVQHSIYAVISAGATQTIRFTESSDVKDIGICNFATSKLPDNMLLFVDEIRLVGVVLGAAPTKATMKAANYGSIKPLASLQNGELDIFSDGKIVVKEFPLSNFITDNNQAQELGTIKLQSPKFIFPGAEFKAEIRTGAPTDANLVLKLELIGVATLN